MPSWKIYAGDREYDREVTRGKSFGIVEADTKEQAEAKGCALLGQHAAAGAWAVQETRAPNPDKYLGMLQGPKWEFPDGNVSFYLSRPRHQFRLDIHDAVEKARRILFTVDRFNEALRRAQARYAAAASMLDEAGVEAVATEGVPGSRCRGAVKAPMVEAGGMSPPRWQIVLLGHTVLGPSDPSHVALALEMQNAMLRVSSIRARREKLVAKWVEILNPFWEA